MSYVLYKYIQQQMLMTVFRIKSFSAMQADDICPLTVVESRKVNLHNVRIFVDVCVCVCVCVCASVS